MVEARLKVWLRRLRRYLSEGWVTGRREQTRGPRRERANSDFRVIISDLTLPGEELVPPSAPCRSLAPRLDRRERLRQGSRRRFDVKQKLLPVRYERGRGL
jgi:hypothetical protein